MTHLARAIIATNSGTYRRSATGSVSGQLVVWLDEVPFPTADWSDFPVVVLGGWLSAIGRILRAEASEAFCYFMEGPFAIRLIRSTAAEWALERLIEHRPAHAPMIVNGAALAASTAAAADAALVFAASQGWTGRDLSLLAAARRRNVP